MALAPILAAAVPSVLGGVFGSRAAGRGVRRPQPLGRLGLGATLSRIGARPLAPEFGDETLAAPLVRQAGVTGRRQRLRAGQIAQTGRLGAAQRARLFQQSEEALSGNLLGARLRGTVATAQATQQERLARERMEFEASLFAEQLQRDEEREALEQEERNRNLGFQIAGSGAKLGFGLAGRILEGREQRRTEDLLNQKGV